MSSPVVQFPVLVTAPSEPLISLPEAKTVLRVDYDEDDALIASLIATAVAHLDGPAGILGRCLVTQVWSQARSAVPCGSVVRLPFRGVTDVVITYYDSAGAEQTFAADQWQLVEDARSSSVHLASGASWPDVATRVDAMTFTMTAGFGAADAVPQPIRTAALLLVGHWYRNREASSDVAEQSIPYGVVPLVAPYRAMEV